MESEMAMTNVVSPGLPHPAHGALAAAALKWAVSLVSWEPGALHKAMAYSQSCLHGHLCVAEDFGLEPSSSMLSLAGSMWQ